MSDDVLNDAFAEIEDPAVVHRGPEIRALAQQRQQQRGRRTVWLAAAAVLLAGMSVGVGLLVTRPTDEVPGAGRWRGDEEAAGALELGYVIEGAATRSEGSTRPVSVGERVIFTVRTSSEAYLCLEERVGDGWQRIHPSAGEGWWVPAGRHWPGGEQPLAFVTGQGPGVHSYRVLLDPGTPDCAAPVRSDELEVEWR